jgi:hypothetical protein
MKFRIFLILTSLYVTNLLGQNNLQFNRVLLTQGDTVPANTAWKIESILFNRPPITLSGGSDLQEDEILINSTPYVLRKSTNYQTFTTSGNGNSQSAMTYVWETNYPIWLPEGTVVQASDGVAFISVVEFLIAP